MNKIKNERIKNLVIAGIFTTILLTLFATISNPLSSSTPSEDTTIPLIINSEDGISDPIIYESDDAYEDDDEESEAYEDHEEHEGDQDYVDHEDEYDEEDDEEYEDDD